MINMANELSNYYLVDLFLYDPDGALKERLDKRVNVLESSWRFKALVSPLENLIRNRSFKCVVFRLFCMIWSKLIDNRLPINMAINHQPKLTGYDLAIAYHHERGKKSLMSGFSRVVDRCVQAKRKVAWMHYDNDAIDLDSCFNNRFYEKMDKIVFVSRTLRSSFVKKHPQFNEKTDYCYNFMQYDAIKEKSNQQQAIPYPSEAFICFSACRLSQEKGIVRAISSFADVFRSNSDLFWYIAGDGTERSNIENTIRKNKLEGRIILLGNQINPYPYMKNANLILNVSYHEAAPVTFFEGLALGKPIFATCTSSATELLNNGKNSFICDNSEVGLRETFEWLMKNRDQIRLAENNLAQYCASNEESISKIRDLII